MILCASSPSMPGRMARLGALLEGGLDWQKLIHIASTQTVMPLVYRCLSSELGYQLTGHATQTLRGAFYGNSVRNLHLAREMVRLTAKLERAGVEPIAIKGPALAVTAYGALALRQFSDIDLLVRRKEVERAAEILKSEGYAPRAGYEIADLARRSAYEITMGRPGALAEIDLHWRLLPPYFPLALDGEDLWAHAVRVDVEGGAVRTLAPPDHLIYLCAHGAKHGWQALGSICDLAEIIRTSAAASPGGSIAAAPINWDDLRTRAVRAGALRALGLGVLLAHDLLGAPAPCGLVEEARREPAIVRAARSFIDYVGNPADEGPSFYQRWIVPLSVIESSSGRLRYIAARALLPSADDRVYVRLPSILNPLYYLLRPIRVALKEAPVAMRKLTRSAPRPADHRPR